MTHSRPLSRRLRPTTALALASLFAPSLFADSDGVASFASLEAEPVSGPTTTITVRSTRIGKMVTLLGDVGFGPLSLGAGMPVLQLSSSAVVLTTGTIGPDGKAALTLTSPPSMSTVYVQALVLDSPVWRASNVAAVTAAPASPPLFTNGTTSLDFVTTLYSTADVDFADLDNDGCPDAVVANEGVGAVPLLQMGDCGGDLSDDASSRLPVAALVSSSCVEIADVNNDTWPDIFLGGGLGRPTPGANLLLMNDGTGHFTALPTQPNAPSGFYFQARPCADGQGCFPAGRGLATDAEFGDVDGDGDYDLLVTNTQDPEHPGETPDAVTLYLNQGGLQGGVVGAFAESASFGAIPTNFVHGSSGDTSFVDADGDGDLDVYTCATGVQNRLFVNDGAGNFVDKTASALPVEVDESFEADFGDFDGDGDLDAIVANSIVTDTTAVHYLENVTTTADDPVFVDASAKLPGSFGGISDIRLAAEVGDVDNDGDLDVFVGIHELTFGGPTDGETVLLVNQGGLQGGVEGEFLVDGGFLPGLFIVADLALADIDLDGDLDLYMGNSGNLFQFDFTDQLWENELN